MDTLILMAGRGTRLKDLSGSLPKPLTLLHGEPLVRWVVENLKLPTSQRFIFVVLKEHLKKFNLISLFEKWNINFEIVVVESITEGAACSALLAKNYFRHNELIIANSDQYNIYNKLKFLQHCRKSGDGHIMTMKAYGPKWSYVKINNDDLVLEVAEKAPISDIGTTGVYYFKKGSIFEEAANNMILKNDRHRNEFYIAPAYNYAIKSGKEIGHYHIGEVDMEMFGIGTSKDFINFRDNHISLKIAKELFK